MRKLFLIIGTMMQSLVVSAVTNDLPDIDMFLSLYLETFQQILT